MSAISAFATALHLLAAVVWVGGMFFAYVVLRPAAGPLTPPERLALWARAFGGFFAWVWVAVVALPATGYVRVFHDFGGFGAAPIHVHVMHGLGLVMIALFLAAYFVPYPRYRAAVAARDWPVAGRHLATIRRIVAGNLALGLITAAVGASGRFWA